jgi:ATP-dependent Clp protease ATP-binding subunit ClpA
VTCNGDGAGSGNPKSSTSLDVPGQNAPGRPSAISVSAHGFGKPLVEATTESLLGNARAMIKIDCAEFQHSHEIAKLIGSPPERRGTMRPIRC